MEIVLRVVSLSLPPFLPLNVKINFDYSLKDGHYDNLPWEDGVLF